MPVARVHSKNAQILVNAIVAGPDVSGWSATLSTALAPCPALGDGGQRFMPGQDGGALTMNGYYGSLTASWFQAAGAAVGVDNGYLITALPEGTAVGAPAIVGVFDISAFAEAANVKAVVSASLTASADNGQDWGVLLHGASAETVTGTGTADDAGAATTNGVVANLHIPSYAGLTNAVIKLQSSPDNVTWTDYLTFATVTGTTSDRKSATGAVPRYMRSTWTLSGTGSVTPYVAYARR